MKRQHTILALAIFLLGPRLCFAVDTTDELKWDLWLKGGAAFGTVTQTATEATPPIDYGGSPIGVGLNKDFLRWFSVAVEFHFILDIPNVQITRTGFDLDFFIHLLGGSRRTFEKYGDSELMIRDPYAVSLLFKTGFYSYGFSSPSVDFEVKGSVFENQLGLAFRRDLDDRNALTFEALATVYSLPAGVERLSTRIYSFIAGWRFYL